MLVPYHIPRLNRLSGIFSRIVKDFNIGSYVTDWRNGSYEQRFYSASHKGIGLHGRTTGGQAAAQGLESRSSGNV